MDLPKVDRFDMVAIIEPLLALGMKIVRADGVVLPEEIRALRDFFTEAFELSADEMLRVRDSMKKVSNESIEELVSKCMLRVPDMNAPNLLGLLAHIANADKHVHIKEVEQIRQVALTLGVPPSEVDELLDALELKAVDYYQVLDLDSRCTKEQAISAYRKKAAMYHPDKVAHMAKEFQDLAHHKFIEIQQAYENIMGRF